jgi:hypothetical protein
MKWFFGLIQHRNPASAPYTQRAFLVSKVSKRIRKMRGSTVHREYGKFGIVCGTKNGIRNVVLAYSPNTPRDIKLSISLLKMAKHEEKNSDSLFLS